jgi:DNA polymerase I-like protein with 3'-5' exonuclease and polymerase domains
MTVKTFDFETSTHNEGNPHDSRNFIVSAHISVDGGPSTCVFFDSPEFRGTLKGICEQCTLLIGCNLKFDFSHLVRNGIKVPAGVRVWDVMLAEYILSGQTNSFAGLDRLAEIYELPKKLSPIKEYWDQGISTENVPREIVEPYGNWDVDLTYQVYLKQLTDPRMTPELHRLILLSGLDLLVLTEMECNGIKYDSDASIAKAEELKTKLKEIEDELNGYSPKPINWDSGDQLSCFLYGGEYSEDVYAPVSKVYKSGPNKGAEYVRNEYQRTDTTKFTGYFTPLRGTETKKSTNERPLYQTSDEVLQQLKARTKVQRRIISLLRDRAKLEKLVGTYLVALPALIEGMNWAGTVHGQFNQVVARTGRLSSSKPNMQNAPPEVDQFFISRYAD